MTNKKVKVDLCLPQFITTKLVTWECHIYEYVEYTRSIILGRYLRTDLGVDLNFFKHVIIGGEG